MRLTLMILASALAFALSAWVVRHGLHLPADSLWDFLPWAVGLVVLAVGFVREHRNNRLPVRRYLQLMVGAGILAAILGRVMAVGLSCLSQVCR